MSGFRGSAVGRALSVSTKSREEVPEEGPILPQADLVTCPIQASMGVLGRKWALVLLRDLAFVKLDRFGQFLEQNEGMSPRILSMRLQDFRNEGLIERIENDADPRDVRYLLTAKGRDAVPILRELIAFGLKHHADEIFPDGRPRELHEVFPSL